MPNHEGTPAEITRIEGEIGLESETRKTIKKLIEHLSSANRAIVILKNEQISLIQTSAIKLAKAQELLSVARELTEKKLDLDRVMEDPSTEGKMVRVKLHAYMHVAEKLETLSF